MTFEDFKKSTLWKMNNLDKSNKKSVDEKIKSLCESINSLDNFVTTSSCAGRIVIVKDITKKKPNAWIYKTHDLVKYNDILSLKLPKEITFLKMEGLILHVCSKNLDSALDFLSIVRDSGIKRAGIFSLKPEKVMIEILSTELLCLPFSKNSTILIDESYLKEVITLSNNLLKRNWNKINQMEKNIKNHFSLL